MATAWVLDPATSQEDLNTGTDASPCLQRFESVPPPPPICEGQCRKHPGKMEEVPPNAPTAVGEELITTILNSDNQNHRALTIWKPWPLLNSLKMIENH